MKAPVGARCRPCDQRRGPGRIRGL